MQPKALQPIAKDEYKDNLVDRMFIWLFSLKMSQALGKGTEIGGYDIYIGRYYESDSFRALCYILRIKST